MEIRQYFDPLLKWWKLILVACVLAAVSSYIVVRQQPPEYQTASVLVIGRAVYDPNPTGGEIGLAQQLSTYYADIAMREIVRGATMEALNLPWLPEYVVNTTQNSQLIEIVVTDTDPVRAQAVANELALQLINQTPSNPNLKEQQHQVFIQEQIVLLEAQIQSTLDEIAAKEAELGSLNSARQISQTQAEIVTLQQKLTTLQGNYTGFLNASSGQGNNSLTLFQEAGLPMRPVSPKSMSLILMSVAIAFLISGGAAYVIEYLDDSLKNADEVNKYLHQPVIGFIPEMTGAGSDKPTLLVKDVKSIEAEAFRALRMNIDFLQVHQPVKSMLVASVGKTEGKSVIAANLAMAMARGGKQVILLDADLRRPSLHKYINIPNDVGLSNIFLSHLKPEDVLVATEQENLAVITTGTTPPNPGELISSKKMGEILTRLTELADIVIVDGPPVMVTDASFLSARVDGVLLVVGSNRTRRSEATAALAQLERVGARVIGVALNRVTGRSHRAYGLYNYDYGAETDAEMRVARKHSKNGFGRRGLGKLTAAKIGSEVERPEPVTEET